MAARGTSSHKVSLSSSDASEEPAVQGTAKKERSRSRRSRTSGAEASRSGGEGTAHRDQHYWNERLALRLEADGKPDEVVHPAHSQPMSPAPTSTVRLRPRCSPPRSPISRRSPSREGQQQSDDGSTTIFGAKLCFCGAESFGNQECARSWNCPRQVKGNS